MSQDANMQRAIMASLQSAPRPGPSRPTPTPARFSSTFGAISPRNLHHLQHDTPALPPHSSPPTVSPHTDPPVTSQEVSDSTEKPSPIAEKASKVAPQRLTKLTDPSPPAAPTPARSSSDKPGGAGRGAARRAALPSDSIGAPTRGGAARGGVAGGGGDGWARGSCARCAGRAWVED